MKADKLHILLDTLDKQEKRYVRLFLERPGVGGDNYRQLYAAYMRNKPAAARTSKKEQASQALTRHLLYGQVLKALRLYHAGRSAESRLTEGLAELDLLLEKKLPGQAKDLLRRLNRMAGPQTRPQLRIELLARELRLLHVQQDLKQLDRRYTQVYREQLQLLSEMEQMAALQKMSYESFLSLKKHWLGKKNDHVLKKIERFPAEKLRSLQSRVFYGQVLSTRQFAAGKNDAAFRTLSGMAAIFEKHPALQQSQMNQYIALLNNLNLLLVEREKFDAALANAARLRAIDTRSKEKNLRIRERVINVEQNIYMKRCDIVSAKKNMAEALRLLEEEPVSPVYRMLTLIDAFALCFITGEYRTALRYLNQLLNKKNENVRSDIMRSGRLFNLLVHFELGHEDLVDKLCAAYTRDGKMDNFEKTVVSFFISLPDCSDKRKAFRVLEKDLLRLKKTERLKETYSGSLDLPAYARSKALGVPMLQCLNEQFAQKKKHEKNP